MTTIRRLKIMSEVVEVPEGHVICGKCGGAGMLSKYDEGIKSIAHDPELALKRPCRRCESLGYVPE